MPMTISKDFTETSSLWPRSVVQNNVAPRAWWRLSGDWVCLGAVLLLWLAVWIPRLHGPIDLRWDASTYYVLGTSLAQGKGYRMLNEPGEIEAVQYPPLLPAIVAAHQRALGTTDYQLVGARLRITYFLLSGLYLIAAYLVVRALVAPPLALVAVAGTGLSFYSYLHPSDTLYAEVPFALLAMLFLICLRQGERAGKIAAGIIAGAAYLLRTAGIVLLALWVVEALARRRYRQAVLRAVAALLPVLAWQGHVTRVTHSADYRTPIYPYQRAPYYYANVTYGENSWLVSPFRPELGRTTPRGLAGRIGHNILALPSSIGESTWIAQGSEGYLLDKVRRRAGIPLPDMSQQAVALATRAALSVLGLAVLAGLLLLWRSGEWLLPLYAAATLGLICLTPWPDQFWRYLAPLTPLSYLCLIVALGAAARALGRLGEGGRWIGACLATGPIAGILLVQVAIAAFFLRGLLPVSYYREDGSEQPGRLLTYEPAWHALDPAFEYLRRHAEPDAVIATSVPHLAYLRSGRRAVLPPMVTDPDTAARYLDAVPASYLVIDEFGRPGIAERYAAPVIDTHPNDWRLVYTTPGTGVRVYARVR
jgi:hypothetical protein